MFLREKVGSTQVDISCVQSLTSHPKWEYVKGILVYPYFKPTQKVRLSTIDKNNNVWLPDFQDTITLAYLHYLYILNGGVVKKENGTWVSSHGVEGEDLAEVLVSSFLDL